MENLENVVMKDIIDFDVQGNVIVGICKQSVLVMDLELNLLEKFDCCASGQ